MSTIWRISSSRPVTGSSCPFSARSVRLVAKLQGFLLAHLRRRHGAARLSRRGGGSAIGSAPKPFFDRSADDLAEFVRERLGLDRLEVFRDADERVAQRWRFQDADQQVAAAHPAIAVHQRRVHPAPLDRILDVRGEIGDGGRASRQTIERVGDVLRQPRRVDLEVTDDAMDVGVWGLQNLRDPVHQLDVRIAPQLAEHRRPLDRLVGEAIQLAKQR